MKRTLSVMVEDKPGALARISTMFARRGFNIDSLAVGPTERPGVSCITLRVDCEEHSLEQIEKQIHKLVNVLRVTDLPPGEAVERELLLLKVSATPDKRAELIATATAFGGRVVDLGPDSVVFDVTGTPGSWTRSTSSAGRMGFRSSSARAASACHDRRRSAPPSASPRSIRAR